MKIERARRMLSFLRRAVDDYEMIKEGDKIAVGVSGGKDSMALLAVMNELRKFYPQKFELAAITVDSGFDGMDFSPIENFCRELGIPYYCVNTEIAKIIFDVRNETNPCSLCARMRRGVLHDKVVEIGYNKLALGHHFDDVVDTFMLNLMYEGRLGCFSPVTYLSNKKITMIRPMIYAHESDVEYFMRGNEGVIPLVKSTCPEDKHTERENVKQLLESLDRTNIGLKHRIFTAIQSGNIDGFKVVTKQERRRRRDMEKSEEN